MNLSCNERPPPSSNPESNHNINDECLIYLILNFPLKFTCMLKILASNVEKNHKFVLDFTSFFYLLPDL